MQTNTRPNTIWFGCYKYGDQGVTECQCWKKMLNEKHEYFIHELTNENSDIDFEKYLVEVKITSSQRNLP
jgi:hypothetical protein